jgi:uncharacterized protein
LNTPQAKAMKLTIFGATLSSRAGGYWHAAAAGLILIGGWQEEGVMRWQGGRMSSNVEDMRGMGGGYGGMGGMGLPIGMGGGFGGAGMGGIGFVVFIIIALAFGVNPAQILSGGGGYAPMSGNSSTLSSDAANQLKDFVSVVLADTEDVWHKQFAARGLDYREPKLVLYSGSYPSACGMAQDAIGPFYCPNDEKVYLDLDFLADLSSQFGAPGDFAQAYVIAHEVGHHVQKLLGILGKAQAGGQQIGAGGLSVRTELQADCFAGIWAHDADKSLGVVEPGDIDEALGAAAAVGDDRLQQETQGRVMPDTFTHGTSAQREHWFKTGYDTGRIESCDTFNARTL